MSISFYSCHADKVLKTFNLKEKFLAAPTVHQKRKLYFAQDANLIDGEGSPLSGFSDFLIRVDNDLVSLTQGNMLNQSLQGKTYPAFSNDTCSVDLGSVSVEKGTLSLVLNRHFVGTINRYDRETRFAFPCRWIQDAGATNTLLLQNHSLVEGLEFSQYEPKLVFLGMEIQIDSVNESRDPNTNRLSSVKYQFHH